MARFPLNQWYEQRHAPTPGTVLCDTQDISGNTVREFRFGGSSPFAFRLFIYNDNGTFKAYRNACPHFDVPLNHTLEELITADGKHFRCMTHGAKFAKGSGLCVEGPCEGESLEAIPLRQEGESLIVGDIVE